MGGRDIDPPPPLWPGPAECTPVGSESTQGKKCKCWWLEVGPVRAEGAGRGDVGRAQTAPAAPAEDMRAPPTLGGPARPRPYLPYRSRFPSAELSAGRLSTCWMK